jgi:hypothetical protein
MTQQSTTSKNAYELRMDMLKMSYDYLDRIQSVNTEVAMRAIQTAVDHGKATYAEWEKFAPKAFTFDDVVKQAEQLYKFVNSK